MRAFLIVCTALLLMACAGPSVSIPVENGVCEAQFPTFFKTFGVVEAQMCGATIRIEKSAADPAAQALGEAALRGLGVTP